MLDPNAPSAILATLLRKNYVLLFSILGCINYDHHVIFTPEHEPLRDVQQNESSKIGNKSLFQQYIFSNLSSFSFCLSLEFHGSACRVSVWMMDIPSIGVHVFRSIMSFMTIGNLLIST